MKTSLTLIAVTIFILLAGCKKKDAPQYSYWYVNNDSFSSNEVKTDMGKVRSELFTNSHGMGGTLPDGFAIVFNIGSFDGGFPTSGNFKLDCSQQNPQWVCMSILYKDEGYFPKANEYLKATLENKKARYLLNPIWFYNELNPLDSILVSGTFNEP